MYDPMTPCSGIGRYLIRGAGYICVSEHFLHMLCACVYRRHICESVHVAVRKGYRWSLNLHNLRLLQDGVSWFEFSSWMLLYPLCLLQIHVHLDTLTAMIDVLQTKTTTVF